MNAIVKKIKAAVRASDGDTEELSYDLTSILSDFGEDAFCEAIAECLTNVRKDDEDAY